MSTILPAREAQVIDDTDQLVPTEAVLAEIQKAKVDSAIRWAVVIGEEERLRLHAQLLPTSAESLSAGLGIRSFQKNVPFFSVLL